MSTPEPPADAGPDGAVGGDPGAAPPGRPGVAVIRRFAPTVLVVLGCVLAMVSVLAVWAERQAVETSSWEHTADELIRDAEVQEALAAYLTDQLYAHVPVADLIERGLPDDLKVFAGPAAGALREVVQRGALEATRRAAVQQAWTRAVTDAQRLAVRILEGGGDRVSTADGRVVLNLQTILRQVADQVGFGDRLADALPPGAAQIEILRSDQLSAAQTGLQVLRKLAVIVPILTLLCFAGAIWAAAGRRRETVRMAAIGLAVVAVLVLVARSLAGAAVIGAVDPEVAYVPAAHRVWDIATSLLYDGAIALLVYALVTLVGTALMGPTRAATAVRHRLAPVAEPRWAYPIAAVLVVLLLWWGPTEGLRRWLPALILVALLCTGMELLRRQVAREAALAGDTPDLGAMVAGIPARLSRLRLRHSDPGTATPPAGDRVGDLERLARLHETGALTDDEFDSEKRRRLAG